jgi:hypothetical protein
MRSGFKKHIPIFHLALLLASLVLVSDCWIPLPEETAIVVEVLDARGGPVNGVSLTLDGSNTAVTGSQRAEGQVFISLDQEGEHTVQLDTATLIDPQGGIGWVPLASQISGERVALSYDNRPFAGDNVLIVPVNKGEITVATIYLDDIQKAPMDNQWLTDGLDTSNDYRTTDSGEFTDSPSPTFWWRTDPSLGDTVNYTFQFWEDDDGDTRFPLGITSHVEYNIAMNSSGPGYIQPDWQVPLAGVQRAESSGVNQVTLWSSQATDGPDTIKYDLYYAPTSLWTESDWEKYPVLRNITPEVGRRSQEVHPRNRGDEPGPDPEERHPVHRGSAGAGCGLKPGYCHRSEIHEASDAYRVCSSGCCRCHERRCRLGSRWIHRSDLELSERGHPQDLRCTKLRFQQVAL